MLTLQKNIKNLHVVRGIAALIVVIYHAKFILWAGGTLWLQNIGLSSISSYILFAIDMLSSCGSQCVIVFFVLSGFVIFHSFKKSDHNLSHFYGIRLLRIYVPFLFSLAISLLVLYLAVGYFPQIAVSGVREYNTRMLTAYQETSIANIGKTILFIPSQEYAGFNFAYWSLLHEAIFYIVFPLYYFASNKIRVLIFIVLLGFFLLTGINIFYYQLYFIAGIFLYEYYDSGFKLLLKWRKLYIPIIAIMYCGVNLLVKYGAGQLADVAAVITVVLSFDYLLTSTKGTNKWMGKLADMSFTLYLNHLWILLLCYVFCYKITGKLINYERYPYYLGVVVSLAVSWVLYKLVEERSLVLINVLKARWQKKAALPSNL